MGKASEHSVFAFSASSRWIPCPGSMAYPENTADGDDAGVYADEGTAAHKLAAILLKSKTNMVAEDWIGKVIKGGNREFEITEEFAGHVQTYVDDVKRRAIGGFLMVEQRVTLEGVEGFDESNYGTSDAIIAFSGVADGISDKIHGVVIDKVYGVVEDLKFGMGEKVYAWEQAKPDDPFTMTMYGDTPGDSQTVVPNYQLMMYALACLADIRLLIDDPKFIRIVINQPRIGNLSELDVPIAVLERFGLFAAKALYVATVAKTRGVEKTELMLSDYLNPGEKQCRWCRALARCPAAAKRVQEETSAGFDVIAEEPPVVPVDSKRIAKAMLAVPFVSDWCRAVMAEANRLVAAGIDVIGPDAKPYKFVEGKLGDRKWTDKTKAETALVGVLGPKAYKPQEILTAAGAAKVLDKKATKAQWNDVFVPLIGRDPGKPVLVLGSDPRPPFSGVADSDEFEEVAE
jgi:hypothetical protein